MQITITDTMTVSAFFASNIYTVNVTTQGGTGTITRDPNQTTMYMGGTIGFTATTGGQLQFAGWHGDVNTLFNPVSARVDSNVNIIAQFVAAGPPVINLTIVGQGSVSRNPDFAELPHRQHGHDDRDAVAGLALRRLHGRGRHAVPRHRRVDGSRQELHGYVLVRQVRARDLGRGRRRPSCACRTHDLHAEHDGSGHRERVGRLALHVVGRRHDDDLESDPGADEPGSLGRRAVRTTLTTAVADGGASISTVPAQNTVLGGDTIQVTPHAKLGYRFTGWSGDATGNAVPLLAVMTVDKRRSPRTSRSSVRARSVHRQPGHDLAHAGARDLSQRLERDRVRDAGARLALPRMDGRFRSGQAIGPQWPMCVPNCLFSQNNPLNVVMESDRSVTAVFEDNAFAFQADAEGSGAVAQQWVPQDGPDTIVLLTAQAEEAGGSSRGRAT